MKQTIKITDMDNGKRIDTLCAEKFPDISRSQWTSRGKFLQEGREKKPKTKVKSGEKWTAEYEEKVDLTTLTPWDFPLKVLGDSPDWVVIDKPVGIAVHPSPSDPSQETILNALIAQFGELSEHFDTVEGQKIARPGLVHRLDKETSGVLLVAKNNETHAFFQSHWGDVEKIYYAVVQGCPPIKGKIEAGLIRNPKNRQQMTVSLSERAKDAVTYFERKKYNEQKNLSLLRIKIPTGRTHQIRVHLQSIGFSIVGDAKYGGLSADRLLLHAHSLTFSDPKTKEKKTVQSHIPDIFLSEFTSV